MSDIEETLDPEDWERTRKLAHEMIDDAIGYLDSMRDREVCKEMPDTVRAHFDTSVPTAPQDLKVVYKELR